MSGTLNSYESEIERRRAYIDSALTVFETLAGLRPLADCAFFALRSDGISRIAHELAGVRTLTVASVATEALRVPHGRTRLYPEAPRGRLRAVLLTVLRAIDSAMVEYVPEPEYRPTLGGPHMPGRVRTEVEARLTPTQVAWHARLWPEIAAGLSWQWGEPGGPAPLTLRRSDREGCAVWPARLR